MSMKSILIVVFVLVGSLAFGQDSQSKEPFKKANTILIHTTKPKAEVMQDMVALLMDNGYSIKDSDSDLGLISTDFLQAKNMMVTTSYNIFVREKNGETVIKINGRWFDPHSRLQSGNYPITYTKSPFTVAPIAWKEMHALFGNYDGGEVYYAVN